MRPWFNLLKVVLPLAVVAWLVWDVMENQPEQFAALRDRPKRWDLLMMGIGAVLAANCLAFYRWFLLVRSLDLPFRVADAFRLGFLGYLLNFVSLGQLGGDLFKAYFLYREQTQRRAQAIATIVVDRVMGLFGLLLVAVGALQLLDTGDNEHLRVLARGTAWSTAAVGLGLAAIVFARRVPAPITRWLIELPVVGGLMHQLLSAAHCYAQRRWVLGVAIAISVAVHLLIGVAVVLGSRAIYPDGPTLAEHMVIVPLANVAGALPVAPMGLGQYEAAMAYLFDIVPAGGSGWGIGVIVALCFRLMTIAVAPIGILYYWFNRRLVRELRSGIEAGRK